MIRTPFVHILVLTAFLLNTIGFLPVAQAQEFTLPSPGVMVRLSPPMDPPILKGIKVHPDNPFRFDFILDKGDFYNSTPLLKQESSKLIKYFLASLTIPEKDLWVNLSPYEKDRIIPNSFGLTEMGRDLLAEDYMLKQITASLIYPEDQVGKKFWKRIYEEAAQKYGTTDIPVNTFNKVWIIPEKAVVYENAKAGTAYVVESKLKVMLEQDYLSLQKHTAALPSAIRNDVASIGANIVREIVIPELTKEVNENKNFSQLRQVYNSLILATWYKKKIKDSILAQVYADRNKVKGVGYANSVIASPKGEAISKRTSNDVDQIYRRYLQAFKKGVYNYIKEEIDPTTQETIPRKYFSGGMDERVIAEKLTFVNSLPSAAMVSPDRAMLISVVTQAVSRLIKKADISQVPDEMSLAISGWKPYPMWTEVEKDGTKKYIANTGDFVFVKSKDIPFRVETSNISACTGIAIKIKNGKNEYYAIAHIYNAHGRYVEDLIDQIRAIRSHLVNKFGFNDDGIEYVVDYRIDEYREDFKSSEEKIRSEFAKSNIKFHRRSISVYGMVGGAKVSRNVIDHISVTKHGVTIISNDNEKEPLTYSWSKAAESSREVTGGDRAMNNQEVEDVSSKYIKTALIEQGNAAYRSGDMNGAILNYYRQWSLLKSLRMPSFSSWKTEDEYKKDEEKIRNINMRNLKRAFLKKMEGLGFPDDDNGTYVFHGYRDFNGVLEAHNQAAGYRGGAGWYATTFPGYALGYADVRPGSTDKIQEGAAVLILRLDGVSEKDIPTVDIKKFKDEYSPGPYSMTLVSRWKGKSVQQAMEEYITEKIGDAPLYKLVYPGGDMFEGQGDEIVVRDPRLLDPTKIKAVSLDTLLPEEVFKELNLQHVKGKNSFPATTVNSSAFPVVKKTSDTAQLSATLPGKELQESLLMKAKREGSASVTLSNTQKGQPPITLHIRPWNSVFLVNVSVQGVSTGSLHLIFNEGLIRTTDVFPIGFHNTESYFQYRGKNITNTILNWVAWEAKENKCDLRNDGTDNIQLIYLFAKYFGGNKARRVLNGSTANGIRRVGEIEKNFTFSELVQKYGFYGHQIFGGVADRKTHASISLEKIDGTSNRYKILSMYNYRGAELQAQNTVEVGKYGDVWRVDEGGVKTQTKFTVGYASGPIVLQGPSSFTEVPRNAAMSAKSSIVERKIPTISDSDIQKISNSFVAVVTASPKLLSLFRLRYGREQGTIGSGFFVGEDSENAYILTNHHVVKKHDRISIFIPNSSNTRNLVEGEVVAFKRSFSIPDIYERGDIALIKISKKDLTRNFKIPVVTLGRLRDYRYLSGEDEMGAFVGLNQKDQPAAVKTLLWADLNELRLDELAWGGASGGPVVNSRGEVVGMIKAAYAHESICVPLPEILKFVRDNKVPGIKVKKTLDIAQSADRAMLNHDQDSGELALEKFVKLRLEQNLPSNPEETTQEFAKLRKELLPWALKQLDELQAQNRPLRIKVKLRYDGGGGQDGKLALLLKGLVALHKNIEFRVEHESMRFGKEETLKGAYDFTSLLDEIPNLEFGLPNQFSSYQADIVIGINTETGAPRSKSIVINALAASHGQSHYSGKQDENDLGSPLGSIPGDSELRDMREKEDADDSVEKREDRRQEWLEKLKLSDAEKANLTDATKAVWTFAHTSKLSDELKELLRWAGQKGKDVLKPYCDGSDGIVIFSSDRERNPEKLADLGATVIADGIVYKPRFPALVPITIIIKKLSNPAVRELLSRHAGTFKRSRDNKYWINFPVFITGNASWMEAISAKLLWRHDNKDAYARKYKDIKQLVERKIMEDSLINGRDHLTLADSDRIAARFLSGEGANFYEDFEGEEGLEYWNKWAREFSDVMYQGYNRLTDILGVAVYNALHHTLETEEAAMSESAEKKFAAGIVGENPLYTIQKAWQAEFMKDLKIRTTENKMLQDMAQSANLREKGGIDLTPANMHLQTTNAGESIKFHLDPAQLAQLQNAPGFVPVIINIQPMTNLRQFLGIQENLPATG